MRPDALILLQDLMRPLGYPSQEIAQLARYLGQLNCSNMMKPILILQSLATSSLITNLFRAAVPEWMWTFEYERRYRDCLSQA
jgi:hypothetical protein